MKMNRSTNQRLIVAGLAACMLCALAPGAHAGRGHGSLYLKGKRELASKQYEYAERTLFRAYQWAKRELGDKINPDYAVSYCQALVMNRNWRTAEDVCAEAVKLARGSLAAKATKYNNIAKNGKLIKKSADRAEWGERYLRNGRFDQAIDAFRKAIKMYPSASYYAGLCGALLGNKRLGPAMAACKKAVALNGPAGVADRARKLLAEINKASASAFTPAQARAVAKITDVTTKLQFIRPESYYSPSDLVRHLATTQSCIAATNEAVAAGLRPSRKIEVMRFHGLKTSMLRHKVNGRFLGWKHYAAVSAVAKLCRSINVGMQIKAVRVALQTSAKELLAAAKLDEAGTLSKTDIIAAVQSVRRCIAAVDLVVANGLSPNTMIDTKHKGRVKLKHAKRRICLALRKRRDALMAKYEAAIKAALEAKLAPYKKVLRGDKFKTFRDYSMYDRYVYTRGRRRLTSPRAFHRASVWFQELTFTHNCPVRVCWRLRRFQFRGNRLRRTTEKTGRGSNVPTSKFR
ncbi:MAG: hypothetical protein ABI333_00395 [bacterium]